MATPEDADEDGSAPWRTALFADVDGVQQLKTLTVVSAGFLWRDERDEIKSMTCPQIPSSTSPRLDFIRDGQDLPTS